MWQRTYSPFAICKNVHPIFLILMEFTTALLQFVKSTTQLLARTTINNFKQPLKTEFKKYSHIFMGSEIFLSEISSQVKYNFKIKLYYVKIQQNIVCATSNEIKIFKFQK